MESIRRKFILLKKLRENISLYIMKKPVFQQASFVFLGDRL